MEKILEWPRLPADRPCVRVCPRCECRLEQHHEGRCGLVHHCPQCGEVSHHLDHRPGVDPWVKRFNMFASRFAENQARRMGVEAGLLVIDPVLPSEAKEFIKLYEKDMEAGRLHFYKTWGHSICAALLEKEEKENA